MIDKSSDKCISLNSQEVETLQFILESFDLRDLNDHFGGRGRNGKGYLLGCRLAEKVQGQLKVTAKPASALR